MGNLGILQAEVTSNLKASAPTVRQKSASNSHRVLTPILVMCICHATAIRSAQLPNWAFNVDANMGHAFGIIMALVGTLRPSGFGAS